MRRGNFAGGEARYLRVGGGSASGPVDSEHRLIAKDTQAHRVTSCSGGRR